MCELACFVDVVCRLNQVLGLACGLVHGDETPMSLQGLQIASKSRRRVDHIGRK
jgi:hypothetical protein